MVPLYQRKYQWADERLVPFWDDVEAKAAEVLGGNNRFQHYMGALILAPLAEGSQIGFTPRVQVVDDRQRLTTFQLFLAALRDVAWAWKGIRERAELGHVRIHDLRQPYRHEQGNAADDRQVAGPCEPSVDRSLCHLDDDHLLDATQQIGDTVARLLR